jgi:hypothetical protein
MSTLLVLALLGLNPPAPGPTFDVDKDKGTADGGEKKKKKKDDDEKGEEDLFVVPSRT